MALYDSDRLDGRAFIAGGGDCGALLRSIDWDTHPLGPVATWPKSLATTVGIVLRSRHPMFLWWGPELVQFYNDAYVPSFGVGRHPRAMGQRGRECWPEIWSIIGPQIDDVMEHGTPSFHEDHLVPIFRNGRIEEVYWTYGYSPVLDDDGRIGGTLVVCTETTTRVLAARRMQTLREIVDVGDGEDVCATLGAVASVLARAKDDLPFAVILAADERTPVPRVVKASGMAIEEAEARFDLGSVHALLERSDDGVALRDPGDPASGVYIARLSRPDGREPRGYLVVGLSPRLPFDIGYRDMLEQIASHIGRVLARADASAIRNAIERERDNLLLHAPVAISLLIGAEHRYHLVNAQYTRMVAREVVGKTYAEAFPEIVGTELPGILDRVYETGEPYVSGEHSVYLDRGDGVLEEHFFRFNLEPIRGDSGAVYGMMSCALDITPQVQARRDLERAHDERVGLLVELESASRAKDEFLAMLGHELRNPLSPIVTALDLMRQRDDEASRNERGIIERQVKHLVRLVDDLLDIEKITRGKVALAKEVIELADVVAKAVEIASVLVEERGHELVIDVPATGLAWEGDPVRLAQVIANLLTNAARYTPIGGHIALRVRRDDDVLVLDVRDDGVGIPAEILPRIFELFVQGERGPSRAEGGLGLGLALAKNLVTLHGGTITAESEGPGRGSTFTIRLSGTEKSVHADAIARSTPAPAQAVRGARILVVDDNEDAAELLSAILRSRGHEVLVAFDPLSALTLFAEHRPDVAVMDIGMPMMDGHELAARMRVMDDGGACRLIALTGFGQPHDRVRSENAGFDVHLVKPVDVETLLRSVAGG